MLRTCFRASTSRIVLHSNWRTSNRISVALTRSHSSQNGPSFRERFNDLRQNGTPELIFGFVLLGTVGVDYCLQLRKDEERKLVYRKLEQGVKHDEEISNQKMMTTYLHSERNDAKARNDDASNKPQSGFKCVVRRVPPNFDGHKCLKNLEVGDIISCIEEGVGPGGQYNLCSISRKLSETNGITEGTSLKPENDVSIGWFPCSCLQKLD